MRRLLDMFGGFRVGLVVILVLVLLYLSVTVVPAGHVGVKDFFGRVSDTELSKSPNAKIIVLGDKSGLPIILSEK